MIDTGSGDSLGPDTGRLATNLATAQIDPADIDHVLLTHMHPDHAGGLISPDGQPVFPRATVHAAKADADHWLDAAGVACATGVQRLVYETAGRRTLALPRCWPSSPRSGPLHMGTGHHHAGRFATVARIPSAATNQRHNTLADWYVCQSEAKQRASESRANSCHRRLTGVLIVSVPLRHSRRPATRAVAGRRLCRLGRAESCHRSQPAATLSAL
jgi:hypothetical protein